VLTQEADDVSDGASLDNYVQVDCTRDDDGDSQPDQVEDL
jgi:hypothetical protein